MEGINDDRPLPFSRENTERVLSLAMQTHQEVPWVGPKDWMSADEWKPIKIKESSEHESGTSSRNKPPLDEALVPRQSQELAQCASSSQRASSSQNQSSRTSRTRSSFGLGNISFGAKWNKISPEPPPRVSPTRPPDASLSASTSTHQTFYEDGSSWVQEKGRLSSLVQPLSEERVSHGRSAATIQRATRQSPLNMNEAIHPDVLRILKEKESLVVACRQDGSSDVASTLSAGMDHFHLVMAVAGEPKSKGDPSAGVDGRGMSIAPRSMAYGQQSQHQRHSESSYEPRYQQDQESDAQLGSQLIETRPQVSHKDSPSSSVLSSPATQGLRALDTSFKSAKNLPPASGVSSDGGRGEMMRTFKSDSLEFTKISDVFEVSAGPSPRPKQSRPFLVIPKDAPSSRDSIYAIGPEQEQASHEKGLSHLNPVHKDPRPAEGPNNMKRTSLPTRRVQSTVALSPEDSQTAGALSSTSHKGERETGEAFRLFGAERVKAKTSGGGGGRPESSLFNRKNAGLSRDESNNRSAKEDLDLMHRLDRRTKFYAGLQLATSDSERMHR
jgi:hypothetical protein